MDPHLMEAGKWILSFGALVLLSIGAWWGKTLAGQIKELERNESKQAITMAEVKTALLGREQLQDERWNNLNDKMRILHADVQALLHAQLTKSSHKQDN